ELHKATVFIERLADGAGERPAVVIGEPALVEHRGGSCPWTSDRTGEEVAAEDHALAAQCAFRRRSGSVERGPAAVPDFAAVRNVREPGEREVPDPPVGPDRASPLGVWIGDDLLRRVEQREPGAIAADAGAVHQRAVVDEERVLLDLRS